MLIVSIDIGSTWTKGAAFRRNGQRLDLERRAVSPTTTNNLDQGFQNVLGELAGRSDADEAIRRGDISLHFSSSAKGGLAVAALGIVPEITLETAKVAAYSAGAKLSKILSYRLTRADIAALEKSSPDILLFAGGTDGGNLDYVLGNARMLAESSLDCSIVYAGNRAALDEVGALLKDKDFVAVDNVLPELDMPNPEPARKAMREIFLRKIVKGKGLHTIIERTGVEPLPTPFAVYEFAKCIRSHVPDWSEFILIDMGGATTDVYSAHEESPPAGTVLRGLPEPIVKRTVEGDLGLRVSATAAIAAGEECITAALNEHDHEFEKFCGHVERIAAEPDYLPQDQEGRLFDQILAGTCMAHACMRHAGRSHEVTTADGIVKVQIGRDLMKVRRIIGSGGWLSNVAEFHPRSWLSRFAVDERGKTVLLPHQIEYWRDQDYLIPLLANVSRKFPEEAAHTAIRHLVRQG